MKQNKKEESKFSGNYITSVNQLKNNQDFSGINHNEIWVDVLGFEGEYMVSNLGRVKSIKVNILKPNTLTKGYKVLPITKQKTKKRVNMLVHRLVAIMFIENPENKGQVNHKNGVKSDNRVENLEWVTGFENQSHAVDFLSARCKQCTQYSLEGVKIKTFKSQRVAAKELGVNYRGISNCIRGKAKTAFGYIWKNQ